ELFPRPLRCERRCLARIAAAATCSNRSVMTESRKLSKRERGEDIGPNLTTLLLPVMLAFLVESNSALTFPSLSDYQARSCAPFCSRLEYVYCRLTTLYVRI